MLDRKPAARIATGWRDEGPVKRRLGAIGFQNLGFAVALSPDAVPVGVAGFKITRSTLKFRLKRPPA